MTPRISWPGQESMTDYKTIPSFKHLGKELWYHMPGSYVTCDGCSKSVPQIMGALQGDMGKPLFAQSMFFCTDCHQQEIVEQQFGATLGACAK